MQYLNREVADGVSADVFQLQRPYPWINITGTLTEEAFQLLRETLPDISLFERKVGIKRPYGQGPHDRAILQSRPGLALSQPWKEFLAELHGETYHRFLHRMLRLPPRKRIILTMQWHYAWQGCSVSPHCDAHRKLATHIFYFNTQSDWQASWGGQTLILDDRGRFKTHSAPRFDDLEVAAALEPRANGSLLFQRTEHSWHGVRPLLCPPESLRKLFVVTINLPTLQVWWRRVRGKDADGYRDKPLGVQLTWRVRRQKAIPL
jgi:hypothetical protein